jgi:arylsulfatase A-like enzyme
MVEAGVRLVQVNWVRHDNGKGGQGYDTHRDHLSWTRDQLLPPTDAAFSSLVEDLDARGLLDETLVVMMGEFGRTPRFNDAGGRDHWPHCFSVVLAGGGIRGGQVLGSSDRVGAFPTSDPVTPGDLLATVYQCLGVNPRTLIHDLQDRPFVLADGDPLDALL